MNRGLGNRRALLRARRHGADDGGRTHASLTTKEGPDLSGIGLEPQVGIGPTTSFVPGRRSPKLSYCGMVPPPRIERDSQPSEGWWLVHNWGPGSPAGNRTQRRRFVVGAPAPQAGPRWGGELLASTRPSATYECRSRLSGLTGRRPPDGPMRHGLASGLRSHDLRLPKSALF